MLAPPLKDMLNWRAILSSRRGGVALQTGLALTALIGMAGLGTEVGFLLYKHRQMQSAADSAALSASWALGRAAPRDPQSEGRAVAASLGFTDDGGVTTTVTVNVPPQSGSHVTDGLAVEVIISQPQPVVIFQMFGASPTVGMSARSVVLKAGGCGLATGSAGIAVTATGHTVVDFCPSDDCTVNGCGLYINSSAPNALTVTGSATVTASSISIVGGASSSGGSSLDPPPQTGAEPVDDPYADITVPASAPCPENSDGYSLDARRSDRLDPGTYCGGIAVSGGSTLKLKEGVYILKNGGLSISGNSFLTGNGVTIVLTGSPVSSTGTVTFSGGATINITAPTSGSTAGLAFLQDPEAPSSGVNSFTGGATQNITGAVYFPAQTINFAGGSGGEGTCIALISRVLNFTGSSYLGMDCGAMPVRPFGGPTSAQLIE